MVVKNAKPRYGIHTYIDICMHICTEWEEEDEAKVWMESPEGVEYIHTYIHTHIHNIHITHTYIHTYTHAYMHRMVKKKMRPRYDGVI